MLFDPSPLIEATIRSATGYHEARAAARDELARFKRDSDRLNEAIASGPEATMLVVASLGLERKAREEREERRRKADLEERSVRAQERQALAAEISARAKADSVRSKFPCPAIW